MDKELDYGQTEERDRKKARAGKTGTYIFLTFWALVVLFPFYWMLLTSVKSYGSYNAEHIPKLFTLSPTLQNYADAFTSVPLGKYLLNTLIFTVVTTALMMVVITLAAYAFARLSFPGKKSGVHIFSVPDDDSGGAGHDHQLRDDHTVGYAQQLCRIGTAVRDLGVLHLFIERKF